MYNFYLVLDIWKKNIDINIVLGTGEGSQSSKPQKLLSASTGGGMGLGRVVVMLLYRNVIENRSCNQEW
jgi:hypothetical protein